MSSTMEPSEVKLGLRVLDPDLPFLAAEVAVDVDNLLAGRSKEQKAMWCLAEKLSQSIEIDEAGKSRSRMDMATLTVLGEAVVELVKSESLRKVEDLLSKATQIAGVLGSENPENNRDELREVGHFCVALSRATAAYTESIRDLRPPHPFRR